MRSTPLVIILIASTLVACSDEALDPAPLPAIDPDPTLERVDLGEAPLDTPLAFAIPDGVIGATIVARADGELGLRYLDADDGRRVIDSFALDGVERFISRRPLQSPAETVLAAALPQSDLALEGQGVVGAWSVTLSALMGESPPSAVSLSLWLRHEPEAGSSLQVDVNWFMADGVADADYVDDVIAAALDGFAGMRVGVVERYPLASGAALIDDEDQYAALVVQTASARRAPALNVIAVSDASGLFGSPAGRAGGIPGLGVDHGSELGAVVIEVAGDLEADAETLRHETGHMAGLFHTRDASGADPIVDTGESMDNVMYPEPSASARAALSATQRRVVLGSTLFRVIPP